MAGHGLQLEELKLPLESLPARSDKPLARLSLNALELIQGESGTALIAVARDQERLLLIDLAQPRRIRWLDLDLRSPDGEPIVWTSPEGLAIDRKGGTIWLINDPAADEGNYRASATLEPEGRFRDYTSLLFQMPLGAIDR